jgi:hypothetical protein
MSGIMIIIQAVANRQWLLVLAGLYFAVMGLFAVGCADSSCNYQPEQKNKQNFAETEFEEIK